MYIVDMVYCSHSARYMLLPGHCLLCISALLWCCCSAKEQPSTLVLSPQFSPPRHTAMPVVG